MNEHSFIRSVHNKLPNVVYRWKINDNFAGGVADAYYSGPAGDCWVEYKFIKNLPVRSTSTVKFGLSANQIKWLKDRHEEGRHVYLVIGSNEGCVITNDMTLINDNQCSRGHFISLAVDSGAVVELLFTHTLLRT